MRRLLAGLAAAALVVSQPAGGQPITQPTPTAPPPLIIVISVDQLSADLFDEYRTQFTGGLARLATGGTVFRNGYQAQAATETCPGHSTILTGALPARSGIVANAWRDSAAPRSDKGIYCAEDESVAGSSSGNYTVSSVHLKSPTLGDLLKQQSPASRNVAIAGKDRSAVMMSGRNADQRWYWSGNRFVTDLNASVPRVVGAVNAFVQSRIAAAQAPLSAPPFCQSRAQQYRAGENVVGAGRFERAAGDNRGFRNSPELDGASLALAAGLVRELGLGRDSAPDVLSIGLAASDYVGHAFGSGGQEMCLQLLALDRSLGGFFTQLDRWGISYAVVLTADHGGLDMPERLRAKGVADAQRIDPALTPKAIGEQVARQTGLAGPILTAEGPAGDNYLDPALRGRDRTRALASAIAAYRAHPQVHSVFSKEEVMRSAIPAGDPSRWTLLQRVRASFDERRSGDLYVLFKPNVAGQAGSGYVAGHGSPWDYDRRVPIIFWRPGVPPQERQEAIATTDIMPTLAALMRVPVDQAAIDGRCLGRLLTIICP